jgi:hypothetical protein
MTHYIKSALITYLSINLSHDERTLRHIVNNLNIRFHSLTKTSIANMLVSSPEFMAHKEQNDDRIYWYVNNVTTVFRTPKPDDVTHVFIDCRTNYDIFNTLSYIVTAYSTMSLHGYGHDRACLTQPLSYKLSFSQVKHMSGILMSELFNDVDGILSNAPKSTCLVISDCDGFNTNIDALTARYPECDLLLCADSDATRGMILSCL